MGLGNLGLGFNIWNTWSDHGDIAVASPPTLLPGEKVGIVLYSDCENYFPSELALSCETFDIFIYLVCDADADARGLYRSVPSNIENCTTLMETTLSALGQAKAYVDHVHHYWNSLNSYLIFLDLKLALSPRAGIVIHQVQRNFQVQLGNYGGVSVVNSARLISRGREAFENLASGSDLKACTASCTCTKLMKLQNVLPSMPLSSGLSLCSAVKQDTPIMKMSINKGLTNQRSLAVTGLMLASSLGWDVLLPTVFSPENCRHDALCYQYSKFKQIPFELIYDLDHFIKFSAERLGVRVHIDIPDGYTPLAPHLWPCTKAGRCRGTLESLLNRYRGIRGRHVVEAPGIAASAVDSRHAVITTRLVNNAFRHAGSIRQEAMRLTHQLAHKGIVVAIHFRFEPDALKAKYAGRQDIYENRLMSFLSTLPLTGSRLVLFFVSALNLAEIENFPMMRSVRARYPGVVLMNKETMIPETTSDVTFVNAALDFEIALNSQYFVGVARSSFSVFVAVGRIDNHVFNSTVLFPSQETSELCSLQNAHHWQFELQLPFNDCVVRDPCTILMRISKQETEPDTCTFSQIDFDVVKENLCTGLTSVGLQCPKNSAIHAVLHGT